MIGQYSGVWWLIGAFVIWIILVGFFWAMCRMAHLADMAAIERLDKLSHEEGDVE